MTSHANCTHPATKAERTKCRAARASEAPALGKPRTTQATSERRRAAARAQGAKQGLEDAPEPTARQKAHAVRKADAEAQRKVEATLDELRQRRAKAKTKKEARAAANAIRTAATKIKHPQRATSEHCSCGSKAGWIDTRTGEPVCIKHVDYNHIKIIPF